jgi:hypothetical protein
MCMPDVDVPEPKPVKPSKPPAPPAPPATQTSAAQEQSTPEAPGLKDKKKKTGRNSLRIPKNQSRGLNLPGSKGGS